MDGKVIKFDGSKGVRLLIPKDSDLTSKTFESCYFDADFWRERNVIVGESIGRHTTWFIQAPENTISPQWVLRHYYRGGLIAKLNNDQYLYTGLKNTRCYRELTLLQQMIALDLPVPKPVAARVILDKGFYRADLLMEKLQASDLVSHLKKSALSNEQWQLIGKTIANFHNNGIEHVDLNAHNILMNQQNDIWLIDFDRCNMRSINQAWQTKNMMRLQRSFDKEKRLNNSLHYEDSDWVLLETAYEDAIQ